MPYFLVLEANNVDITSYNGCVLQDICHPQIQISCLKKFVCVYVCAPACGHISIYVHIFVLVN